MAIDTDKILSRLDSIAQLIDLQFTEIENLISEVNPNWRDDVEEERRQKNMSKQTRRIIPVNDAAEGTDLLDNEVLDVLRPAWCEGNNLKLPPKRLKRDLYDRVNEVLLRLGGKWKGGKTQAHVFDEDPAPLLAQVLSNGKMPITNPLAFYWTSDKTIDRIIATICIAPKKILEPSAGDGAIVKRLLMIYPEAEITAIELDGKRAAKLRGLSKNVNIVEDDFLNHSGFYDCVIMNPPFAVERDQLEYVSHIHRAYDLLLPGGLLRSIAPESILFSDYRRITNLRRAILKNGSIEKLDEGSFYEAGTMIKTVLVKMTKPD